MKRGLLGIICFAAGLLVIPITLSERLEPIVAVALSSASYSVALRRRQSSAQGFSVG
jgi:hypothetical protein